MVQNKLAQGMPIMDHPELPPIPWEIISPHERQAERNHGQSLLRLAERGGLGPDEAVAILEDRRWHKMNEISAINRLSELANHGRMRKWPSIS